jgi:predicted tellurium resistance membrane protein TerC
LFSEIDNIIFISIVAGSLPPAQQDHARRVRLGLAMITRILLLLSLIWIMGLTEPLISISRSDVTGRALILIAGGLFLIAKSTREIHLKLEESEKHGRARAAASFAGVLFQILALVIVFSLDSVITAVGMVDHIAVMIAVVMLAVAVLMVFAAIISCFVERHPTLKMLALSFLLLIGVNLIGDGLGFHIRKGYTYFAMGFSVSVEILNLKVRTQKLRATPA